jgi:endonuclease/exonuclease/phosphatase family metal-dependent hydrolase
MRARLSLALTLLTVLFFLQAQRVFFASLFALASRALLPQLSLLGLVFAVAPLIVFLGPLLPLSRRFGRQRAFAISIAVAAIARVPMGLQPFPVRLFASALVVGSCAVFISLSMGYLERRAVAAGVALAVAADQALRMIGWSYDPTLRQLWIPAQAFMAIIVLLLFNTWRRVPRAAKREVKLERRMGGLRLRGALAFGLILFLEATALGSPEVLARLARIDYIAAGVLLCAGSLMAAVGIMSAWGPIGRHRKAALVLTATAAMGVLAAWRFSGWLPALLFAAGHFSLLLLLGRALVPAGGRRGAWTVCVGFFVLLCCQALYAGSYFFAFTVPALERSAPWIFALAMTLLTVTVLLIPRPNRSASILRGRSAGISLAAVTVVALSALAWRVTRPPATELRFTNVGEPRTSLHVATYNVHHGFDASWRYDPESIARAIERSGADVVALQEVPAGLSFAYGTDLALWLGRRLRMKQYFAPSENQLLGDAVLSRVAVRGAQAWSLRTGHAPVSGPVDPRVLTAVDVLFGTQAVRIFATRLNPDPDIQEAQLRDALSHMQDESVAMLMGDLKLDGSVAALRLLESNGFVDAFRSAGAKPTATMPTRQGSDRADWIMLRGLTARTARVLQQRGSDHWLVAAEVVLPTAPPPEGLK